MKLLSKREGTYVFHLSPAEQQLLVELLRRYPCIPPGHHAHTRVTPHKPGLEHPDALQLLEESLEEHRAATSKQIQAWLADPKRLSRDGKHARLSLTSSELEQLLQVINDIRVGSWISLGEPKEEVRRLDPVRVPQAWAMELAGYFQMQFLDSLGS